jgi:hypothetical protein
MSTFLAAGLFSGFLLRVAPGPAYDRLVGVVSFRGAQSGIRLLSGCLIGTAVLGGASFAVARYVSGLSPLFLGPSVFVSGALLVRYGHGVYGTPAVLGGRSSASSSHPFRRGLAYVWDQPSAFPATVALFVGLAGADIDGAVPLSAWLLWIGFVAGAAASYGLHVASLTSRAVGRHFSRLAGAVCKADGATFVCVGLWIMLRILFVGVDQSF